MGNFDESEGGGGGRDDGSDIVVAVDGDDSDVCLGPLSSP